MKTTNHEALEADVAYYKQSSELWQIAMNHVLNGRYLGSFRAETPRGLLTVRLYWSADRTDPVLLFQGVYTKAIHVCQAWQWLDTCADRPELQSLADEIRETLLVCI